MCCTEELDGRPDTELQEQIVDDGDFGVEIEGEKIF
jgi:hypothetical protein